MVAVAVGIVGVGLAGDFTGSPKLAPLYGPPPYQITDSEHLLIFFEADEAAIRELLPPGLEPAPGNVALLNMYRANNAVGLGGPYTATYITVDVANFDTADGTKGRFMVYGWYGPDRVTAALREVMALPVKLGTTKLEREGNRLSAVLTRDGVPLVNATIALNGQDFGRVGGTLNYPAWRQISAVGGQRALLSELIVWRIPFTGNLRAADPVAVNFTVPDKDPLLRLQPKRLLSAAYFKGEAFSFGAGDVVRTEK
jgi:acetoacetate decarboxylase